MINIDEIQLGVSISSKVEVDHRFFQQNEVDRTKVCFNFTFLSAKLYHQNFQLKEIMPTLAKKVFIGKFEPVKWKCRAPLQSGKLCERMDRYKCPFHGKVIGRDGKTGKATNEKEETLKPQADVYNPLGDRAFLADIEAQTGKDLGSSGKKTRKNSKKGNLTDINAHEKTTRSRLEKLLCNSKSLRKIGHILDNIERRQNNEKFHHNFNYALSQ
jgi:hypothetical protein